MTPTQASAAMQTIQVRTVILVSGHVMDLDPNQPLTLNDVGLLEGTSSGGVNFALDTSAVALLSGARPEATR